MTRILIVEDQEIDYGVMFKIARDYGVPINTKTTTDAIRLLQTTPFICLVLDLTLPPSGATETLGAFKLLDLRIPVIVVTGNDDPTIRTECESLGWSWVSKHGEHFERHFRRALEATIGEEIGACKIAGQSQLDAILAMLNAIRTEQQNMKQQIEQISARLESVWTQMFGKPDEFGNRTGGCVARHKAAVNAIGLGQAWVYAAFMATAGAGGAMVLWILERLTR